ncbi:MAG TPA: hypothetical protein VGH99_06955 [Pseudonocardia sp.]|jgi:hypothetical protein
MLFLFAVIALLSATGVVLLAEMYRRNESLYGVVGTTILCGTGVLGAVYGMLDSA